MGFFEDQKKVGGGSLVDVAYNKLTGGNQAPGKATLTGSMEASLGRPPTPAKYASLDHDLVEKLWLSRQVLFGTLARQGRLSGVADLGDEKFWDTMDGLGTQELHTLVQVVRGAKGLGLWDAVQTISDVYTHPGSFGIKFLAAGKPALAEGRWGRDIQSFVAKEHPGGEQYEWFRSNTGAGAPGMHVGLSKADGDHDLHWDPTNPMMGVGSGTLQIVEGIPTVIPKGQAIYSPAALILHLGDIGKAGKGVQKVMATKSDKFLSAHQFREVPGVALKYAGLEEAKLDVAADRGRAARVIADIRTAAAAVDTIYPRLRVLAMEDDTTPDSQFHDVYGEFERSRSRLWEALAALIRHLRDEVPGHTTDLGGYEIAKTWEPEHGHDQKAWADYAEKRVVGLQAERDARRGKG
ncbi:MAG: hypothetical protein H0T89_33070 [Deltaproteobacteria bacterium]|nr:hypothetical protein [Deltaproteobacteria bacterium]MDQ3300939.1 hypothetical protein [Myxococcota bacterium]